MSTEVRKPGVEYSVENDRIFRDNGQQKDQVAKYDPKTGIVEILPEMANYRVRIISHLNDKGHRFTEIGKIGLEAVPEGIPIKPKKNPRLGDKTPSVVEWYAKYRKEVFVAKFGIRELQVRTGFDTFERKVRDDDTGKYIVIPEQVPIYERVDNLDYSINSLKTGEQRLIADCKTHLTAKMRDTESNSEYDWELDKKSD